MAPATTTSTMVPITSLTKLAHRMMDCAIGAEDAELGCGIGSDRPVRRIVQGHQGRAADGAQHLRGPEREQLRVVAAGDCGRERDGGIKIGAGAAEGLGCQYSAEHGDGPAGGDDHPARVGRVGLAQGDAGIDAVAQQDENKGAHKLAKPD